MSAITAHHDDHEHEGHDLPYPTQLKANRLGLWLFFISEFFLFGALLLARFYLWLEPGMGQTRPALSQEMGFLTTAILLISSYFVYRGETAMEFGEVKQFTRSFMVAAVLGALFFVGVVFFEWNIFGLSGEVFGVELFGHLKPWDGVYGGVFYMMTGMHALHVLSGIFLILVVWNRGRKGSFTAERHWGVEGTALYWHYVDVIWIIFYPALYLIGTAVH
ncbi:MAG: heme-copper oxidase subunit III [Anaerolineae bacterium]|nr:heme-copper oxidase subunit III [Anaerolineae bacterium]